MVASRNPRSYRATLVRICRTVLTEIARHPNLWLRVAELVWTIVDFLFNSF